jgi:hypothetical protein
VTHHITFLAQTTCTLDGCESRKARSGFGILSKMSRVTPHTRHHIVRGYIHPTAPTSQLVTKYSEVGLVKQTCTKIAISLRPVLLFWSGVVDSTMSNPKPHKYEIVDADISIICVNDNRGYSHENESSTLVVPTERHCRHFFS